MDDIIPNASLPLSNATGIGFRTPHYDDILKKKPKLAFLEIHPENYFGGGYHVEILEEVASYYPLSFHAVGLSLGSAQALHKEYLLELKGLIDRFNPALFSDHVSWSASGNSHLPDLLPLPYTQESLEVICNHIDEVQQFTGRQMLVENPSTYLTFSHSTLSEPEFLMQISSKTGCGLLLDINNIYVQAHNNAVDVAEYFSVIDGDVVQEIHLAGHIKEEIEGQSLLIDTHSQLVCDDVWKLYHDMIHLHYGCKPTLIEWDKDIPKLEVLLGEAKKADDMMNKAEACYAAC